MSTTVVRYQTRAEAAEDNVRLVERVYSALAKIGPSDFRYITYRLDDGVTFVHISQSDGVTNPLLNLPEFAEFQRELAQRCVMQPVVAGGNIVGSYGWTN
jgi:hypothetical protein